MEAPTCTYRQIKSAHTDMTYVHINNVCVLNMQRHAMFGVYDFSVYKPLLDILQLESTSCLRPCARLSREIPSDSIARERLNTRKIKTFLTLLELHDTKVAYLSNSHLSSKLLSDRSK